ncbi:MAG: hypothetical protein J6C78_03610 [Muribaculaceae bacterium]|nr:hypothetical protein [Muribaculaceae bacterium]
MQRRVFSLILFICMSVGMFAQQTESKPITWSVNVKMTSEKEGVVIMKAHMLPGWHLYGFDLPEGGPKSTTIDLSASKGVKFIDAVTPDRKPIKLHDAMFDVDLTMWEGTIAFRRKFKVLDMSKAVIAGTINYMGCNDQTCLPPQSEKISKPIKK